MNKEENIKIEHLFPFIFTKNISDNELKKLLDEFIEREDYEKCNFIKNLIDKNYFGKKEKRKKENIDELLEVIELINNFQKIKKKFDEDKIEKPERMIENLKSTISKIEEYNKKEDINEISLYDLLKEVDYRIKKIKKSKCPFKLFSSKRKIWKKYKNKAINQLNIEKNSLKEFFSKKK